MPSSFASRLRPVPILALLACAVLWGGARAAMAQAVGDMAEVVSITPVAGWRAGPGRHVAGLRIELAPGWKTYWRSAGSAGIAPRLTWHGSENVVSVVPSWPTPVLFRQGADLSIGYPGGLLLPLVVATGEGEARLRGRLDLGVCSDICLPVRLRVGLVLPAGGDVDADLAAVLADTPRRLDRHATCRTRPGPDGTVLTGTIDLPPLGGREAVVFELPDPAIWVTDARISRTGDRIVAASELMSVEGDPVALDLASVRITVIGAQGAVELAGCAP